MINPELADKIAFQRLLQAKRAKVKKMVVSSFDNLELLKRNSEEIEILELSDVLAHALGIKIKKTVKEKESTEEEQIIIDLEADQKIKEELKEEEYEDEEDVL